MSTINILEYDPESHEATVQISTIVNINNQLQTVTVTAFGYGTFEALTYDHFYLSTLSASSIVLEDTIKAPQKIKDGTYGYYLWVELIDVADSHARLGDIDIFLDGSIPKDISNGACISFTTLRLDFETR